MPYRGARLQISERRVSCRYQQIVTLMVLDIAGVQIRLIGKEKVWEKDRFCKFLSKEENSSSLSLRAHRLAAKSVPRQPLLNNQVDIYSKNGKVFIERWDFKGFLDFKNGKAEVRLSSESSFESFLRVIYSLILPQEDGIAIHASSLMKDGKVYIFPGKSGTGKTTLVRLSPEATLLTDEISLVKGIGAHPVAFGTPFQGDLGKPGENISASVRGVYFPVKDKGSYLERLNPKRALEKLLPNVVFFGQDQELLRRVFHLSYEFVISLPCYELHFLPEPSFWSLINEHEKEDKGTTLV